MSFEPAPITADEFVVTVEFYIDGPTTDREAEQKVKDALASSPDVTALDYDVTALDYDVTEVVPG